MIQQFHSWVYTQTNWRQELKYLHTPRDSQWTKGENNPVFRPGRTGTNTIGLHTQGRKAGQWLPRGRPLRMLCSAMRPGPRRPALQRPTATRCSQQADSQRGSRVAVASGWGGRWRRWVLKGAVSHREVGEFWRWMVEMGAQECECTSYWTAHWHMAKTVHFCYIHFTTNFKTAHTVCSYTVLTYVSKMQKGISTMNIIYTALVRVNDGCFSF